jgi:Type VI secretion system/phage-baseplate injector OB domain
MSNFLNPTPSVSAAGTSAKRMWHGIYTASVVSTQDPNKANRVTLKVPQVLGSSTSNWAVPLDSERVVPSVNTIVYAVFLGGDINHPMYLYTVNTSANTQLTWQPVATLPSGFTGSLRYRMMSDNTVLVSGTLTIASGASAGTVSLFTYPSIVNTTSYAPVTIQTGPLGLVPNGTPAITAFGCRWQASPSDFSLVGFTGGSDISEIDIQARYELD